MDSCLNVDKSLCPQAKRSKLWYCLPEQQYSFLVSFSVWISFGTNHPINILKVISNICLVWINGSLCCAVCIDLSKVFSMVNYSLPFGQVANTGLTIMCLKGWSPISSATCNLLLQASWPLFILVTADFGIADLGFFLFFSLIETNTMLSLYKPNPKKLY